MRAYYIVALSAGEVVGARWETRQSHVSTTSTDCDATRLSGEQDVRTWHVRGRGKLSDATRRDATLGPVESARGKARVTESCFAVVHISGFLSHT